VFIAAEELQGGEGGVSVPKVRKTRTVENRKTEKGLSAATYDELISLARRVRKASEALPAKKSEVAASTALTVLQLSDGNVLLKVGSLARRLGVDLHTLTRGFHTLKYPAPPKKMQISIRCDAARRMLCGDVDRKIDSIASELGYKELGSFSKFFQQQNGISPIEYRKRCGQKRFDTDAQFGQ
jgi:transcriptional regulator GlxA family with amidase domain